MPSRRSARGSGLNLASRLGEQNAARVNADIEERRRFENERDYVYRQGWEDFDSLDADTRQDLLRESGVVGGFSTIANVAMSPRRFGASQATRAVLSRVAPELAKKVYAQKPSKAVKSLMTRLKAIRKKRAVDRQKKAERIERIERELEGRRTVDQMKEFLRVLKKGEKREEPPGISKEAMKEVQKTLKENKESINTDWERTTIAQALKLGTNSSVLNARTAYETADKRRQEELFRQTMAFRYRNAGVEQ